MERARVAQSASAPGSGPVVLLVHPDPAAAALAGLALARDLPSARLVHVAEPVALGRALARGGFSAVAIAEDLGWSDATQICAALADELPGAATLLLAGGPAPAAAAAAAGERGLAFAVVLPPGAAGLLALPAAVGRLVAAGEEARRLARLETRLQSLLDEAEVGFFRATLDGELREASPALLRLLGLERVGEIADLDLPAPYFRRQDHDALLALLDRRGALHRSRLALRRRDGTPVDVALTERLCLDADGELVVDGLVARVEDEGPPPAAAAAVASQRTDQELQRLAYVASHELRAPLRQVAQHAELLDGEQLPAAAAESLRFVREGVVHMQDLIDDLLAFARVDSRAAQPEATGVQSALDAALADLAPSIEQSGAEVTADGALPTVLADRTQLRLLLKNLVENAVKFRGDGPPRVRVTATPRGREWEIAVADNGIGIAPEHQAVVFDVFRRLHPEFPGTGIGLAICRRIVERHGGRLWVESEPGAGSTFRFTLIATASAAASGERASQPATSIDGVRKGRGDG